ncbi:MAG: UDP-N-acetylenolpyruvoylglucosamine reductase [Flavobacteriales bacterium]|nr:UDP-N-acetylenolpyruvoylglucosamine reductase [Flavobacteriales bacterium]|tara:strand:- start:10197 stop:11210 length:1014 start_codon:yes stop_codon:yes gene_type:complete
MIASDVSLKKFNTFGIDVSAKLFSQAENEDHVRNVIQSNEFKKNSTLILGGGSNLLFTKDFNGLVLRNHIQGIEILEETDDFVFVKVGGGVVWHDFVLHCIDKGWNGVENLSLIPGNVGASPMQNIGAYGVEIKEVFHELEAIHLKSGEIHYFRNEDCCFGYRDSVFKNKVKGEYLISRVIYKLSKKPNYNISYGAIEKQLENMGIKDLSAKSVSDAVIAIRQSKLPDPSKIGNSGSFFKNPIVTQSTFDSIKLKFPNVVAYPAGEDLMKLAAGWLIEQAGWKGKTYGNYGVHKNQALVLVNYGGASGKEIYDLSSRILDSIKEKFGVNLEREVNIY